MVSIKPERSAGPAAMCLVAIIAGIASLSCNRDDEPLFVDESYSEALTVLTEQYEAVAHSRPATTVKVVQIFAPGPRDVVYVSDVTRGRLVYESRTPSEIEALFESLQAADGRGNCHLGESAALAMVAYDRDLPRVGIIRLYECQGESGPVIGIRPLGDAALVYSSTAVAYLHSIGALQ